MSLDVQTCEQIQSGDQMCNLLKGLAEKVLSEKAPADALNGTDSAVATSEKDRNNKKTNKNLLTLPFENVSSEANGSLGERSKLLPDDKVKPLLDFVNKDLIKSQGLVESLKKMKSRKKSMKSRVGSARPNAGATKKGVATGANTIAIATSQPIEAFAKFEDVQNSSKLLNNIISQDKLSSPPRYRPMADVLICIGTSSVKHFACKDLADFYESKPTVELNEEEVRSNVSKVREAEKCFAGRIQPYKLPYRSCRCGYKCHLKVQLMTHKKFGRSTCSGWFRCCYCSTFRTRSTTLFVDHLCDDHGVRGTTEPPLKHMCNYCPYENRDWRRNFAHEQKCRMRFMLSRNQAVHTSFNDIAIDLRSLSVNRNSSNAASALSYALPNYQALSPYHTTYYNFLHQTSNRSLSQQRLAPYSPQVRMATNLSTKALALKGLEAAFKPGSLTMRQIQEVAMAAVAQMQMSQTTKSTSPACSRSQNPTDAKHKAGPATAGPSCEICSEAVASLEALLKHMQQVHQINIKSIDFFLRGKAFVCKTCFQGFWTQMGLSRHQQQVHSKPLYPCFVCGPVFNTDILTHLMTKHNISLQDMLTFGWCYICKVETKTPERFTQHMVATHSDLFPNKSTLETMVSLYVGQKNVDGPQKNVPQSTTTTPSKPCVSKSQAPGVSVNSQISFSRAKHRCSSCQAKFESEAKLESHYQLLHVISCTRCKEKWTSVEAMLKHFNQKHYAEKDPCVVCKEHVKIGVPMIRHMKRMHLKKCTVLIKRLSPSERMKHLQRLRRAGGSTPTSPDAANPLHYLSAVRPRVVVQNYENALN